MGVLSRSLALRCLPLGRYARRRSAARAASAKENHSPPHAESGNLLAQRGKHMVEKAEKIRDGIIGPSGSARGSGGSAQQRETIVSYALVQLAASTAVTAALGVVALIYFCIFLPSVGLLAMPAVLGCWRASVLSQLQQKRISRLLLQRPVGRKSGGATLDVCRCHVYLPCGCYI